MDRKHPGSELFNKIDNEISICDKFITLPTPRDKRLEKEYRDLHLSFLMFFYGYMIMSIDGLLIQQCRKQIMHIGDNV